MKTTVNFEDIKDIKRILTRYKPGFNFFSAVSNEEKEQVRNDMLNVINRYCCTPIDEKYQSPPEKPYTLKPEIDDGSNELKGLGMKVRGIIHEVEELTDEGALQKDAEEVQAMFEDLHALKEEQPAVQKRQYQTITNLDEKTKNLCKNFMAIYSNIGEFNNQLSRFKSPGGSYLIVCKALLFLIDYANALGRALLNRLPKGQDWRVSISVAERNNLFSVRYVENALEDCGNIKQPHTSDLALAEEQVATETTCNIL